MPPADLIARLTAHGQEHLLHGWDALSPAAQRAFAAELAAIDFAELAVLHKRQHEPFAALPPRDRIAPLAAERREDIPPAAVAFGEEALRRGEVAVLLVAGGQGSRLGSDRPKGVWPVGPVSGATLFRIHAEKVLALRRRYAAAVPFLVMTSPATHADTVAYYRENDCFGLPTDDVHFFQQGTMPALDRETGRLLLEAPGKLFLSPNGHGGTLTALADSQLLPALKHLGRVKHFFYFQVDNPLVRIADPAVLGRHIQANADATCAVVFKEDPAEKVGIFARIDGRLGIVEYSDLPAEMAAERDAAGDLVFRAGNPAIHIFSLPFLEKVTSGDTRLAFHIAKKKVPYFDPATGTTVTPTAENALKFELFVFDALPMAERYLAVQVNREDEFAPLKNATGADSPQTVRDLMIGRAARWLQAAGVEVPAGVPVEIAPTFALDEAELRGKIPPGFRVAGPTYLS